MIQDARSHEIKRSAEYFFWKRHDIASNGRNELEWKRKETFVSYLTLYYSSIVMEGMSKTTKDLRISGKPGLAEYDSMTDNDLTASWMATWTDRQTEKTVGKVARNPLEVSLKNAF
jgi:hypothetical protein